MHSYVMVYGVFTLADTDTDIDTDKMGLQPLCICVGACVSVCVDSGNSCAYYN